MNNTKQRLKQKLLKKQKEKVIDISKLSEPKLIRTDQSIEDFVVPLNLEEKLKQANEKLYNEIELQFKEKHKVVLKLLKDDLKTAEDKIKELETEQKLMVDKYNELVKNHNELIFHFNKGKEENLKLREELNPIKRFELPTKKEEVQFETVTVPMNGWKIR